MFYEFTLNTRREQFINVTAEAARFVRESGVKEGLCLVYSPHTTAGITINENADPDVVDDFLFGLGELFPERPEYRHLEGNTSAHMKASYMGSSATVIIEEGRLRLGTWQGIYFCEFDGPRTRRCYVKIVEG